MNYRIVGKYISAMELHFMVLQRPFNITEAQENATCVLLFHKQV